MLAFENFVLLMAVIFGLQFVDRSFGPVLPLYVGAARHAADARAARRRACCSRSSRAPARSATTSAAGCCSGARRARVIAASAAAGAAGAVVSDALAGTVCWLFVRRRRSSASAIGVGDDRRLHRRRRGDSGRAHGAGFGVLTSASLVGLAVSPFVGGLLGATSIRAVFLLDVVGADRRCARCIVSRMMIDGASCRRRPRRRRTGVAGRSC